MINSPTVLPTEEFFPYVYDRSDASVRVLLDRVCGSMGMFLANVPRHWRSHVSTWPGTDVPKPEYMTTPMYGYALARRCWLREETLPRWRKHLNPGVRAEFKQALRFLQLAE
jgi:hypothetical protein